MIFKYSLSAVWLVFMFCANAQNLSFYKENITMKIGESHFYVSGNYYLRGDSSAKHLLMYPFPVDSAFYGDVDSIYVFDLSAGQAIDFEKKTQRMIVFPIHFGFGNEITLLISYRQQLLDNQAEYILETTKTWRKPLARADFQLIVPNGIEVTGFSYPPDGSTPGDRETLFYWTKSDFMPEYNMIFEFRNLNKSE
jgi:hypothetical protein